MPLWIIPLYILSGITLVVTGYLTYANKPLCFRNIAFRNEAMKLHRIKLRQFDLGSKEKLSPLDEMQYAIYKRADKKYLWIDQILNIAVLVFLFTFFLLVIDSNWASQMPLYIVSGFFIFIGKISTVLGNSRTRQHLCVTNQSFYDLDIMESFHKQMNAIPLNEEDKRHIKNYETEIRWTDYHLNVLYVGILLHIVATLLHGILSMFRS